MALGIDVAVEAGAELGEGPCWWAARELLLWVDITGQLLHRFDPRTGTDEATTVDDVISLVVPREGGGLVAAIGRSVMLLGDDLTAVDRIPVEEDEPEHRLNDGGCDPAGRLWIGTMRSDGGGREGALYRVDPTGRVQRWASGLGIPNGTAWSPDGGRMYHIDTPTGEVAVYDYDADSGTATGRRALITVPDGHGHPDGMAVDATGCLWIAFYGGWAVRRYRPDGRLDREVELPAEKVTKCAFGGADLGDLYITTATEGLDAHARRDQPLAGSLFRVDAGVQGLPTHAFGG